MDHEQNTFLQFYAYNILRNFLDPIYILGPRIFIHYCKLINGPQGFGGAGEKGYLFSGSWGALIIIYGELAHTFADLGITAKK